MLNMYLTFQLTRCVFQIYDKLQTMKVSKCLIGYFSQYFVLL